MRADLVEVDGAALVRIQRGARSRLRTTKTIRRGTRCLLRGFEVHFLDPRGRVAAEGNGWFVAGDAVAAAIRALALDRLPFHALVEHERLRRVRVVGLLDEAEALALIRRVRAAREDAEWLAAAPPGADGDRIP